MEEGRAQGEETRRGGLKGRRLGGRACGSVASRWLLGPRQQSACSGLETGPGPGPLPGSRSARVVTHLSGEFKLQSGSRPGPVRVQTGGTSSLSLPPLQSSDTAD